MLTMKRANVKPAAQGARRAVVPRAAADRRAVLGSLVAGVSSLAAGKALADATPVDLFDDRNVRKKGFEIIYEARDLDLDQATRDGLTQFRGDLSGTKDRYKEASRRIQKDLGGYIQKEYWSNAIEELRNQVGTFRFDLKNLASSKGDKATRKQGLAKAKDLVVACEQLDLALRKKDQAKAQELYKLVNEKLSDFNSFVA